tara:strand:+ start:907 stop:1575 length:669 start_codon:yes stop_codon:yes gene_type:complete
MILKIIYVDTPFWRAEVPRLSLFYGSIDYEDIRISREDFLSAKKNGFTQSGHYLPFRQIPVLIINNYSLTQTGAMSRYCGKLSGLYPKNDDLLAAKIDQIIDICTDMTVLFSNYRKIIETNIDHNKRKEFFDNILMNKMKLLENMLLNDNYFKDLNSLSIAEIAIWRIFGWFSSGLIEGFPTNFVKQLKTIQMICLKVEKFDFVKEWISKTYHPDYVRGNYI